MSIFSSWLAAPNSLVITYTGRSTRSTISESLWPMPAVSTITRSNPADAQERERVGEHGAGRRVAAGGSPSSA